VKIGIDQQGFNFVELMVVIAISSIIFGTMFIAYRTGDEQVQTANVKMTIQDNAREGLYKMVQEVRLSASNRLQVDPIDEGIVRFCIPDSNAALNKSVNDECSQDCQDGVPADSDSSSCPFEDSGGLNGCIADCNNTWDPVWSTDFPTPRKDVCNINCTSLCSSYCNADYATNWKDSQRIEYRRTGADNEQVIRINRLTPTTNLTTVIANDLKDDGARHLHSPLH